MLRDYTIGIGTALVCLATAPACATPAKTVMVKTTVHFKLDAAGGPNEVQATGPSEDLKQRCIADLKQLLAAGAKVGPPPDAEGRREYECYDAWQSKGE